MVGAAGALHIELPGLQRLVVSVQGPFVGCPDAALGDEVRGFAGRSEGGGIFRYCRETIEALGLDDLLDGIVVRVPVELKLAGEVLPVDRVIRFPVGDGELRLC